jgi:hypothetical protein
MSIVDNGEVALWEPNLRPKQRPRKNLWPRKRHRGSLKNNSLEYIFYVEILLDCFLQFVVIWFLGIVTCQSLYQGILNLTVA